MTVDRREMTPEDRIARLEQRVLLMARGYAVLIACAALALGLSLKTQHDVRATQHTLATSNRNGAQGRVLTVNQRCELTSHVGLHFPDDLWFRGSYLRCLAQLATTRQLAARAP